MPDRNVAVTYNYIAWDTANNIGKTGDGGNHTISGSRDGTQFTPTDNTPSEIDSTNLKGVYSIDLTAVENNGSFLTMGGESSTGNIVIIPISWANESNSVDTTLAVRTSDSVFTINAGSGTNSAYVNMVCAIYDVSGDDWECRKITAYVGADKKITVDTAFTFTVAANDLIRIGILSYVLSGTGATAAQVWAHDVSGNVTQGQGKQRRRNL